MKNLKYVVLSLLLVGCSGSGGGSTSSSKAPVSSNLDVVMAAAGCTVSQLTNGASFTCNGTTANVYNGSSAGLTTTDANGLIYANYKLVSLTTLGYTFWSNTDNFFIGYKANGTILYTQYVFYDQMNCLGNKFIQPSANNVLSTSTVIKNLAINVVNPSGTAVNCVKLKNTTAVTATIASLYDPINNTCSNVPSSFSAYEVDTCVFSANTPATLVVPMIFQ